MIVDLCILGEPLGKQRPRYSAYNGIVRTYTPQKTINYESLIAHEYNEKYGKLLFEHDIPIKLVVKAYYPLSKSDFGKKGLNKSGKSKIDMGYCPNKNDIDNVIKIVMDALNSICFYDDRQVVEIVASKNWTQDTPRLEIQISEIGGNYDTK